MTLDEHVIDVLTQDLDPDARADVYMSASRSLERGDLRQAAEKIWGSAALAVKAYAMRREGRVLTIHGELWEC